MYEVVLAIGFIVFWLAAAWTLFRALQISLDRTKSREETRGAFAYIVAFALLAFIGYYLGLLLPPA